MLLKFCLSQSCCLPIIIKIKVITLLNLPFTSGKQYFRHSVVFSKTTLNFRDMPKNLTFGDIRHRNSNMRTSAVLTKTEDFPFHSFFS